MPISVLTDQPKYWAPELAIPTALNVSLLIVHLSVCCLQMFVLPYYLLPNNVWWGLVVVPLAALSNPLWALVHECVHDAFHPKAKVCRFAGRFLSILFGSPFQVLRSTHLSHHKFNRSPLEKGTEMYAADQTSRFRATVKYYSYILCGVYLLEVASALLFLMPKKFIDRFNGRLLEHGDRQEKWLAYKFLKDGRLNEMRVDGLAIVILYGASAIVYRRHWVFFAIMVGLRALLISLMDNIYHYGTPLKVTISGHNLFLPRYLSAGLLHFNYHRVHHAHPNMPWTELPRLYAHTAQNFDDQFSVALFRQFRGPLSVEQLQPQALAAPGRYPDPLLLPAEGS
jgi:fatty acid desaturase